MTNRVIHFEIQADNVERAKKFYESVLHWKIDKMMSKEDGGGMDYWGLTTGTGHGINGGLFERPKKKGEKFFVYKCTIEVSDIDQAIEDVKSNGGKITREKSEIPKVGWFADVVDTEGNEFGLMQPTDWKPM